MLICLSTPNSILNLFQTNRITIPIIHTKEDSDSDSDSDSVTELLKDAYDENNTISKSIIVETMKQNKIQSNKFSEDFIGEYSNLFFEIHSKQIKKVKKIQFFKVEIMDTDGIVFDMTYKIGYFIRDDYIHLQKLMQFYKESEFIFILYGIKGDSKIYKKIVHIPTKKEILSNTKCIFGKIML